MKKVDSQALQQMLARFDIDETSFHASGTEASVYILDNERLLKIYSDPKDFNKMIILKKFYSNLETDGTSFQLPIILDVQVE